MSDDAKIILFVVGVTAGVFMFIFSLAIFVEFMACDAKWPNNRHEFGVFSSCMVEYPAGSGRMVPAAAIRVVDGK